MYVGAMEMPHHIPTLLGAMSFVAFVNVYSPTSFLTYLFNFSIPWASTMVLVTSPWKTFLSMPR
jgi:hypothetical protein